MKDDELMRRIVALSPEARARLERQLLQRVGSLAREHVIPRRTGDGPWPLSFCQQRLWFLEQLEPGQATYNSPKAGRLGGRLHRETLDRAFNAILSRHEALRTNFLSVNGAPVQVVRPAVASPLSFFDLAGMSPDLREGEMRRLLDQEARRPFDLERDPMLRWSLIRLSEDDHVLLVVVHHIASDGWSSRILWRELSALYGAFAAGRSLKLPELPIQYADYACWQQEYLKGEALERHLAYWRKELDNAPTLDLPGVGPRPPVQTHRGGDHRFALPSSTVERLEGAGRSDGATLFMVLAAAFNVLLHRYTGQDDIVIGCPVANRDRPELDGLIGFFVNTLPLRTDLSGRPTFREVLRRVRFSALEAYAHQELPFERLVEELRPERDLSRMPLIQAMFGFQIAPGSTGGLPGLRWEPVSVQTGTAKFDLILNAMQTPQGLALDLEYSADLFDRPAAERMAGHLAALLEGVTADPDRQIGSLPMLTEGERRRFAEWNATEAQYPREAGVHELVAAQAQRRPHAPAVEYGDERLTYAELEQRANGLARRLRDLGVGVESRVGLSLERSAGMVVGMLAILKAGGAYVPLDPAYPRDRLEWMAKDAGVEALVAEGRLRGVWSAFKGPVLDVAEAEVASGQADGGARGGNMAYVMYTSGSTGVPKGTAVTHRAISRLVCNTDYVRLGPGDRVAQASNASFDAATFEVWGPLVNGGCVVGLGRDEVLSPRLLVQRLKEKRVHTVFLTTALFNEVAREAPGGLKGLRDVLFGGEAVDVRSVREVLKHGGPARLLHVYGPTETTTFATWHEVKQVAEGARTVPIGRPIANTRAYVVDEGGEAVPQGVVGEIWIGGDGVARGYWAREELTAERFVEDPFEGRGKLYRTGDLGRYGPDGSIEFVGRRDDQVKLRGFRVEPAEVESVLRGHVAVQETVVVTRGQGGEKSLVGYVVKKPGREVAAAELRRYLDEKLPAYMVPSALLMLDRLPLTANGKVDRSALPAPESSREALEEPFVAPADDWERRMAAIWESVLGVRPIGMRDNFFRLGGHSLLAIRLYARIEKEFGRKLPLAALFTSPTVAHLAAVLRGGVEALAGGCVVPIQPNGANPPFFCVHWAGGDVLNLGELGRRLAPDQPFYGLQAVGLDGAQPPHCRVEDMAVHYVTQMRAVQPQGPYYIGGFCTGGLVAFEMARRLQAAGEKVALLVLMETSLPAPVVRHYAGRVLHHVQRMFSLPLSHWSRYLAEKAKVVWRLVQRRRRLGVGGYRAHDVVDEHQARVLEANMLAVRAYAPAPYGGRIVILLAEQTTPKPEGDRRLLMGELAQGGCETHRVPGDHTTIVKEPHAPVLADRIRACVLEAHRREMAGPSRFYS